MTHVRLACPVILLVAILAGCATETSYVATGRNMDIRQAQYVFTNALRGGRLAATDSFYRISQARLRNDGVGFLWIKGRDPGLLAPDLVYDTPPQPKVCYYRQASNTPTVDHFYENSFIVHGLCDVNVYFDGLSEAEQFADALYVLEHAN